MILVSSCLAGLAVKYNGTHCLNRRISKLVEEDKAVSVCPELLGGFSTPREPAEIVGGDGEDVLDGKARVVDKSGKDVTELYLKGAYATLVIANKINATIVVLKENSPSCGSSMIYNGKFTGEKIVGNGVTSALLKRNGLQVISEEQFEVKLENCDLMDNCLLTQTLSHKMRFYNYNIFQTLNQNYRNRLIDQHFFNSAPVGTESLFMAN